MLDALVTTVGIVLFVVPGYVWRSAENYFAFVNRRVPWEQQVLGLLTRSFLALMPWMAIYHAAWRENWIKSETLSLVALIFATTIPIPALLGAITGLLRQRNRFRRLLRHVGFEVLERASIPSAWDYKFSALQDCWVILTLKNGSQIRGFAGGRSYFSSDPDARDLYLESVLTVDDNGDLNVNPQSEGIYIRLDEIVSIEFLKL